MKEHESPADYVEIAFPRPIADALRALPDRHSFVAHAVEAALPPPHVLPSSPTRSHQP